MHLHYLLSIAGFALLLLYWSGVHCLQDHGERLSTFAASVKKSEHRSQRHTVILFWVARAHIHHVITCRLLSRTKGEALMHQVLQSMAKTLRYSSVQLRLKVSCVYISIPSTTGHENVFLIFMNLWFYLWHNIFHRKFENFSRSYQLLWKFCQVFYRNRSSKDESRRSNFTFKQSQVENFCVEMWLTYFWLKLIWKFGFRKHCQHSFVTFQPLSSVCSSVPIDAETRCFIRPTNCSLHQSSSRELLEWFHDTSVSQFPFPSTNLTQDCRHRKWKCG